MPTALRAPLASLLLVPAATIGAFLAVIAAGDGEPLTPWPWLAGAGAFAAACLAFGRWAGVVDWGFIPFLTVAGIAVPWWATAIAVWLWLLAPAGLVAGVLFWFCVLGALALVSLLAG